jgi:hypothetical protein
VIIIINPSYMRSVGRRPAQAKSTRPYLKIATAKRAGVVAQVVEWLPRKCKTLSSNLVLCNPISDFVCASIMFVLMMVFARSLRIIIKACTIIQNRHSNKNVHVGSSLKDKY